MGGKLTWDVPLDAKKAFYLEMGVPNVKNIVIAIVVVVLILAGVIVSLVMRRRRKKIS
ncbi:hypothetical protein [Listeria floridensis]|uniref:hypothetical protein n=1 Tax=Listeria floridensis TaxID=1494962 RepID=UPI0012DED677|nr:hypothetical protein [Listeria floridensis]